MYVNDVCTSCLCTPLSSATTTRCMCLRGQTLHHSRPSAILTLHNSSPLAILTLHHSKLSAILTLHHSRPSAILTLQHSRHSAIFDVSSLSFLKVISCYGIAAGRTRIISERIKTWSTLKPFHGRLLSPFMSEFLSASSVGWKSDSDSQTQGLNKGKVSESGWLLLLPSGRSLVWQRRLFEGYTYADKHLAMTVTW